MRKINRTVLLKISLAFLPIAIIGISMFAVIKARNTNTNQRTLASQSTVSILPSYDVIIAGAGSGGIGAAIQAARGGASVLLLEETDYIGGQMTAAGVSQMDGTATGIYQEFISNIKNYYAARGKTIAKIGKGSGESFEANVGQQILLEMISKYPQITLSTRTKISLVTKAGPHITSVSLSNGQIVNTKILIDATEYGDVLPLAGANYRAGTGTNTSPAPGSCVQDITYTAYIKKYSSGIPAELRFSSSPPGYSTALSIFKNPLILSDGTSISPVITKNGHSDGWAWNYPFNFLAQNEYRGVPDSSSTTDTLPVTKTGVNFANDYPTLRPYQAKSYVVPYIVNLTTRYLEDPVYRKQINCEAKLKTLQFLYYIQDPNGLDESLWGISSDEHYNTPYNISENSCPNIGPEFKAIEQNMPVIPYIRESRRMIGLTTMVGKDIKNRAGIGVKSSIAVGMYPADLHNCYIYETSLNETPGDTSAAGPFQIPIESLISNNVDNLLAAEKNISQSRIVNGATRLQPITMAVGQAAGALAALSVKKNIKPAQVPVLDVQKILLKNKSSLVAYTDLSTNHPYFYDVQLIALRGIMIGYGNKLFGVNDPLTRGQAAILIDRAFDIPPINITTPTFTDVPVNHIFAGFIEGLYRSGFTAGCSISPKKYCPNNFVTNAQLAVFVSRGLNKISPSAQTIKPTTSTYSDVPASHFAYSLIETLAANGFKFYCDEAAKKFCPDQTVSRAKASYIINTILDKQNR